MGNTLEMLESKSKSIRERRACLGNRSRGLLDNKLRLIEYSLDRKKLLDRQRCNDGDFQGRVEKLRAENAESVETIENLLYENNYIMQVLTEENQKLEADLAAANEIAEEIGELREEDGPVEVGA